MNKSLLAVYNIKPNGTTSGAYSLVLEEVQGKRKLPIVIGIYEAKAIAMKLENMMPSRPLTHDLLQNVVGSFGIEVTEVVIHDFVEGVFFARLNCVLDGNIQAIDARPSDAVALAVRFGCPIFCEQKVMEAAAVETDGEEQMTPMPEENPEDPFGLDDPVDPGENLATLSPEDLQRELDLAIQKEDYERAGLIRDEMDRRSNT